MSPLLVAVAVALAVPLVTRGSYRSLAATRWDFVGILLLGLGLQIALDLDVVTRSRWHDIGFGILVASYVLVLAFCGANLAKKGMGVVLVGVAMNALAILVNQGMPVDVPQSWIDDGRYEETVKHHLQTDADTMLPLTDIIALPDPFATVVSFGDIVISVGLVDAVFHASRRKRQAVAAKAPAADDASEQPTEEEEVFETDDIGALLRITDAYLASYDERARATGRPATPGPSPPVEAPSPDDLEAARARGATSADEHSRPPPTFDEFVPSR